MSRPTWAQVSAVATLTQTRDFASSVRALVPADRAADRAALDHVTATIDALIPLIDTAEVWVEVAQAFEAVGSSYVWDAYERATDHTNRDTDA